MAPDRDPGRLGRLIRSLRIPLLLAWLGLAAGLTFLVQPLDVTIAHAPTSFLPPGTPIFESYRQMSQAFGSQGGGGITFAVFQDRSGISDADLGFMRDYSLWLRARADVTSVGDFFQQPQARASYTSHDNTTVYMPIAIRPQTGTVNSTATVNALRQRMQAGRPASLSTWMTGTAAIVTDYQESVKHSIDTSRIITIFLVIIILLVVYRSPISPVIPLATVAIAYLVSRGLVSVAGMHGLRVSTFTDSFLIAITFGAGTDYCLFLISRFKEQLVAGEGGDRALSTTLHRVGEAIGSSAVTVVLGGLAMGGAAVSLFNTTGPAIAVAVVVALLAGLTLTPAMMSIAGPALYWPGGLRTDAPGRFWTAVGSLVSRRPRRVIAATTVVLLAAAMLAPAMTLSYDQVKPQPTGNESVAALTAMRGHFPAGELFPTFVLIRSDHALLNTADLLTVDDATQAAQRVAGVAVVRSFTRPQGERIPETGLTDQLSRIEAALARARDGAANAAAGQQSLVTATGSLASGSAAAAQGAAALHSGISRVDAGVGDAAAGAAVAVGGAQAVVSGSRQLAAGATAEASGLRQLRDVLQTARDNLASDPDAAVPGTGAYRAMQYLDGVLNASTTSPQGLSPLDQLIAGEDTIAAGAQSLATGSASLHDGLERLASGIATAHGALDQLSSGGAALDAGLSRVAAGAGQVAGAVAATPGASALSTGLTQVDAYLQSLTAAYGAAGFSPYYVPAGQWGSPGLDLARTAYLSPDGHATRILVLLRDDPYSATATREAEAVGVAVRTVLDHSSLKGAHLYLAGDPIQARDLAALSQADFQRVLVIVLLGVFLVLMLLLRSLVAPLYLLASVILSFATSMGVTVGLFQLVLGKPIDWTVPIFSFVMLVAVGADYNIFLMARLREEVRRDPLIGISRAVRRTGRIITSAGVIFAGTFVAMMISPVVTLQETGFTIAFGLLVDTLLVRSFLVPAVAVVLGRWNWWPSQLSGRDPVPVLAAAREVINSTTAESG